MFLAETGIPDFAGLEVWQALAAAISFALLIISGVSYGAFRFSLRFFAEQLNAERQQSNKQHSETITAYARASDATAAKLGQLVTSVIGLATEFRTAQQRVETQQDKMQETQNVTLTSLREVDKKIDNLLATVNSDLAVIKTEVKYIRESVHRETE